MVKKPGRPITARLNAFNSRVEWSGADYVGAPVASAKETSKMTTDLVCDMTVDDNSPHRSTHAGQTYVFCSPSCKQEIDKEPERYVVPARGSAPRSPGV